MKNTSGQGKNAVIPSEIDRWNWGAFLANWIWGIANNTYIALLMFIPFVNLVMPFVLGVKGSAWAWQNLRWNSVEHFRHVQRLWAIWSLVAYIAIIGFIAGIFFLVMSLLKGSEAYVMGVGKLQTNREAVAILGPPVITGFPSGSIRISGPSGNADLSFSATGSKARGMVYLNAIKDFGKWKILRIELKIYGQDRRINLNQ